LEASEICAGVPTSSANEIIQDGEVEIPEAPMSVPELVAAESDF
jgi:hypothetical protein